MFEERYKKYFHVLAWFSIQSINIVYASKRDVLQPFYIFMEIYKSFAHLRSIFNSECTVYIFWVYNSKMYFYCDKCFILTSDFTNCNFTILYF